MRPEVQKLAKRAALEGRFTKSYCRSMIEQLAIDRPELIMDLACLYDYFTPNPTPKAALRRMAKHRMEWVAAAVAQNDARPALNLVHGDKENGAYVASDGHRIHVLYDDDVVPGFFDPRFYAAMDEPDEPFPEWKRYARPYGKMATKKADDIDFFLEYNRNFYGYVLDNKSPVRREYIDQALAGLVDPVVSFNAASRYVLISGKTADGGYPAVAICATYAKVSENE